MSDNLQKKNKENFFSIFIRKVKMAFIKNKGKNEFIVSETVEEKKEKTNKNNILENLKVDVSLNTNIEYEKKEFMKNLTKNPELLEIFSNDRLEKILQYYLEENEKKRELLKNS